MVYTLNNLLLKKFLLGYFCMVLISAVQAQDFMGLQSSNYAGVTGAYSNPANIVDSRYKVDIALVGLNMFLDNNYLGIKRSSLKYEGKLTDPKSLVFPAWANTTNSTTANYYKNNFTLNNNGNSKSIAFNNRIVLPSFLITINQKNAIAFNWSVRNYLNIDGVSQQLVDLAYSEFALPSLLNKRLTNKNLNIAQAAWAEYGLSYAHVMVDKEQHFLKLGGTLKLLQGLEAAYLYMSKLDYQVSTKDTFSFFNTTVAYGHSDNLNFDQIANGNSGLGSLYKFTSSPGFGFDIGAVYEWRPDFKEYQYNMDGEKDLWRKDKNKYKLKLAFAVNDIGGIRFTKGGLSNDFSINVTRFNVNKFSNVKDINTFDSTVKVNFPIKNNSKTFTVLLPAAINIQADYSFTQHFYVNLAANITNFYPNSQANIHDFTTISLTPRIEGKWFGLSAPVTFQTLAAQRSSYALLGAAIRLGPLVLGSNDLFNFVGKNVYGTSFYALLKVPIPYGHRKDTDGDGVSDRMDMCMDVPGIWEFTGCPDRDGDHVQDKEDKCPEVPGIISLKGCPDKDGDGITDGEDNCPDQKGPLEFNGCPDRDGDKIIDKDDECPDDAGLKEFKGCPDKDADGLQDKEDDCPDVFGLKEFRGCPDTDKDGTADKYDACPDVAGPKEYKGCPDKDGDTVLDKDDACADIAGPVENQGCPWPDTDKDGIIDREDSCVTVPGEKQFKGCPPPMKAAEKKIIEKAFASLEFATGKDIIKPKSFPSLNDLAKLLINHSADWTLKLAGHTDNEGSEESNMLLSEKRAKAVKAYLVKKGVADDKVIAEWFGQTMPIEDNATAKGRQKNRRVEMKIIFKE